MSRTSDKAEMVSILKRAVREMEAGYQPEFLVFMYPRANEPIVDHVAGYHRDDFKKVKVLVDSLENLVEQIQKSAVLAQMGCTEDELDEVVDRLQKDLSKIVERTFDNLKKEPPVKDVKQAEAMLRELMEKKS